jgi:sugar phosphate isomerase/epimerase
MFQCLNTGVISLSASFDDALQLASRHGFAGLDLPLHELLPRAEQYSAQEIAARLQAAGVCPGGWGLPVEFRGSEEVYQAGLRQLPSYARLAQALGSPWCSTWLMPFSDSLNYAENMEFHAQRLRPIAQILADYGCRFGLEFVGPQTMRTGHRYEFIHTIDGIFELGERIGTDNIGLLLDAFHWYTAHATIADLQKLSAPQVVYVHVNDALAQRSADEQIDNQRMLPAASGVIDIAGFLQAVQGIGYSGPVVVEPFNAELVSLPANERVAAVKRSLDTIWAQAGITK